ncbi:MAG: hypothetical protein GC205_01370 [Bacteroidetes bacterium]|nr:hypothetical protein [Bacteroidota bacterium]
MARYRFYLFLILLLGAGLAQAQTLSVSEAEKISSAFLNYRILGKNNTGVLVYKHRKDRELIETYDDNMALVRRKTLDMQHQPAESVNVLLMADGSLIHFYVYKSNKVHYLEAQLMDERLVDVGEPVVLDSVNPREDGNWDEFMLRNSEDRSKVMVFRQSFRLGQVSGIQLRLFDAALRPLWADELLMDGKDKDMTLQDAFLSNRGDVAFVQVRDKVRLRAETYPHATLHFRPADFGLFRRQEVSGNLDVRIGELAFAWDVRNNRLVGAGFYSEAGRAYAAGVLYVATAASGEAPTEAFNAFSPELVKNLTGRSSKKREEIPLYDIQEIIVRSDGGFMLISEYISETSEAYEFTDYDPYYGGYRTSTRYINYHEYEDILLLMMEPDGTLSWEDVIRKKQVSREDHGRNSSFALLNTRNNLFFIFNEDISYNTNVLQYVMDTKGSLNRTSMFNANTNEVMLVPRKARQVSGNEIVIPSIYKNSLAFVKLTY